MKSYDLSRDRSNPIQTILYLPKVDLLLIIRHLIYLTFLVNFHTQLFESTYTINLFNQSTLNWRRYWLVIRYLLRRMYVRKCSSIYSAIYDSSG